MTRILFITAVLSAIALPAIAQNRIGIGTETPAAKLHIISLADENSLLLEKPAANGVPFLQLKDASRNLLWLHTNDTSNIFIGLRAGELTTGKYNIYIGQLAGQNSGAGQHNIGIGNRAQENNKGEYSTAVGTGALRFAANVSASTAIGANALQSSTFSYNTAVGSAALMRLTNGAFNCGVGGSVMVNTTSGRDNVAMGSSAMLDNSTGSYNTALGSNAFLRTTVAQYNTAVGYNAGSTWNYGYNNVFVGANTDGSTAGQFNMIAIGQGTISGGSSVARFGNSATGSYGGWANWTNVSDGRFKTDVQENVPGLAFIKALKPVTYHLSATSLDKFLHQNNPPDLGNEANAMYEKALKEKEAILYTGFIAQDVETAAGKLGFDFSGVDKPKSNSDTYGLRYAEFVVPLVKAVQEQQALIEALQKEVEELKRRLR